MDAPALRLPDVAWLDEHIRPVGAAASVLRTVLLTGATGFLGRHLLAELLRHTDWQLVCLVRAEDDAHARRRLEAALADLGDDLPPLAGRWQALAGRVERPGFDLPAARLAWIGDQVDAIIHAAAQVSWLKRWQGLAGSHVEGTRHAIALACTGRPKSLVLVSTLAVCYASDGPAQVDETTDMRPWLDRIPLGYAQAKCLAEGLARQAAARGLPVSIARPALICGDSRSGEANTSDLIARMLRGCALSGLAPDVDWRLDCIPVDTVATALRHLAASPPQGLRTVHLRHPRPRHWRELVLWLQLRGYPQRLTPLDAWQTFVRRDAAGRAPCLHALQRFFLARPAGMDGRSLPELYLGGAGQRIDDGASQRWLAERGIAVPELDAPLLARYLHYFRRVGYLPGEPDATDAAAAARDHLRAALDGLAPDYHLQPGSLRRQAAGSGLLSELGAQAGGRPSGLWRATLTGADGLATAVLLKQRADDATLDRLAVELAELTRPGLGAVVRDHLPVLPHRGGQDREFGVWRHGGPGIRRHMPAQFGPAAPLAPGLTVNQWLGDASLIDSADRPGDWRPAHLAAAVDALVDIHAGWLGEDVALAEAAWLDTHANGPDVPDAQPLWSALEAATREHLDGFGIARLADLQRQVLSTLPAWWPAWQAAPQTLVHNDFNPRNLAFRPTATGLVCCAYDWELAAVGLPQGDLAELLCFVVPAPAMASEAPHWLERHRRGLEAATGQALDPAAWRTGFGLALRHLMLSRIPFYAMTDRIRPQAFLGRVLAGWVAAMRWVEGGAEGG
ncbi:MAG: thioester reductase domain-containing protein [Rhodocyclaceae bacterium]|nr:thioester reductase domain-containing protein [Rhodocyclaceae bacterium]